MMKKQRRACPPPLHPPRRGFTHCHAALGDAEILSLGVLSYVDAQDLALRAGLVSQRFRHAAAQDMLWEPLCVRHWATKARRYHLTPERRAALLGAGAATTWAQRYADAEIDGRRSCFNSPDEVSELTFDFSFRGMPDQTASECFKFGSNGTIAGHPNGITYHWALGADGTTVHLGEFPRAKVTRLHDWHWAVANGNVVWCSLDDPEPEPTLAEDVAKEGGGAHSSSSAAAASAAAAELPPAAAPPRALYPGWKAPGPGSVPRRCPRNAAALYPHVFAMAELEGCTAVETGDGSLVMLSLPQWHLLLQNLQRRNEELSRYACARLAVVDVVR